MDHAKEFLNLKQYLFSIAYRITGSYQDSEDILQESYLKWIKVDSKDIITIKSYLGSIVARLSLDLLKKASRRKESYIGPYLPEPVPTGKDEFNDDQIEFAFLVILEALNPIERAVFILREAFSYDYEEIAKVVDSNSVNCRKIYSRAKEAIQARKKKFEFDPKVKNKIFTEFIFACYKKDPTKLSRLLREDITVLSDGGGKVHAARIPIIGMERVVHFLLRTIGIANRETEFYYCSVNGRDAIVGYKKDQPSLVQILSYEQDRIANVYSILNPEKLRAFEKKSALLREGMLKRFNLYALLKLKFLSYFS